MEQGMLEKLEFGKIQKLLADRAYSPGGRALAAALEPATELEVVRKRLDETQEAMDLLHFGEPAFLGSLRPVTQHLARARAAGILSPVQLYEVYHLCRAARLTAQYCSSAALRVLNHITADIRPFPDMEKLIQAAINEDGIVLDDASKELKFIRRQIDSARHRIKDYLHNFIRSGNNQSLLQDTLITDRAGRYVIPVKQEHRHDVKGIVHDESASGATVFIEPTAVVEQNNKIKSLEIEEKREIERILRLLSLEVSDRALALELNYDILSRLDMIFARGHLAYDLNAFRPEVNDEGRIDLGRARHPLLGEGAVPINVALGKEYDILVITGPNTGGKTVVLKTIGLLTAMALSGLFIPAREKSDISVFKKMFVDIGDEQSIEQSLSTFSSHLKNIVHILEEADDRSLVLLDELGAGTDPVEGSALARAILEELKDRQSKVVVTTHQSDLKTFAYQNDRVENACVEFNPITLEPTYELTIGTPGQSNAFEIALRLGLAPELVERGRLLVPQREMEIGNMIRQLKESRYQFDTGSRELDEAKRQLEQDIEELQRERAALEEEKAAAILKARQEADQYVRRIKREANESLEELKELLKDRERPPKWHEVEQKSKRLRDLAVKFYDEQPVSAVQDIRPGDFVMVRSVKQHGTVVEGPNAQGEVTLQIGSIKLTVHRDQIEPGTAKSKEEKNKGSYSHTYLEKTQQISPQIDLRGKYAEDAIEELDKYLEDANLAGLDWIRIIHGKGTGALRSAVRNYLKGHRYVTDFRDGSRDEGGYGATVVSLK